MPSHRSKSGLLEGADGADISDIRIDQQAAQLRTRGLPIFSKGREHPRAVAAPGVARLAQQQVQAPGLARRRAPARVLALRPHRPVGTGPGTTALTLTPGALLDGKLTDEGVEAALAAV